MTADGKAMRLVPDVLDQMQGYAVIGQVDLLVRPAQNQGFQTRFTTLPLAIPTNSGRFEKLSW